MNALREHDVQMDVLRGKRIAVIGFGSQGRAQALNLRDGGFDVVVGLRRGSRSFPAVEQCGLRAGEIGDVVRESGVIMLLVPDEVQPEVFAQDIGPNLKRGAYIGFAHGFAVHYRKIVPAVHTNVMLVAPKGIGPMVRQQYERGGGVPCLVAAQQDPSGDTLAVARAYACGIGGGRAGILDTSFREETETDLFSEQSILCGGLTSLIKIGFETLVEAGYSPEVAYFECLHEVKLIADLVHERGIGGMRAMISNTAKYGDLTRGSRVIGPPVREAMKQVLAEVQSGEFADQWMAEHASGQKWLDEAMRADAEHPIEEVGRRMRALMPWLNGRTAPGESLQSCSGGCGHSCGFVPEAGQAGPTPGSVQSQERDTGAMNREDPCCQHIPAGCAGEPRDPVDQTGCDWPGFEAPPCWFVKESGGGW